MPSQLASANLIVENFSQIDFSFEIDDQESWLDRIQQREAIRLKC